MTNLPILLEAGPDATPTRPTSHALDNDHIRDLMGQCIHCGLCLSACPTYSVFHTEMDSPRGRIALISAAADGRIDLDGPFQEHIELCLGCRACETACPSGVQYGLLYEAARTAIEETRTPSRMERAARWLGLRQLMPHKGRLRLLARSMKLYQLTGIQRVMRGLNARGLNVLPKGMQDMEALLPPLPDSYPDYSKPAPAIGEKRGEVVFLYGCVQDAFLSSVNAASVRVLQRNGYEVHFPQAQTCCGAAQLHSGEHAFTQELARANIDACRGRDYVAIISNAGGCGATLKQYDHILADDPLYGPWAKQFVAKLQDISEFLADHLYRPPTGQLDVRATYVESCHLRHGQKVTRQPRQLLQAIPGVQLVELKQPDMCCGSAGIYNIVQPETANQILDAKMADVAQTHATTVVTTNTGCHMQMVYGVRKANAKAEVVHLVELLDRSYFKAEQA
jgi:glycolate oxidase iron-sulfur subunit